MLILTPVLILWVSPNAPGIITEETRIDEIGIETAADLLQHIDGPNPQAVADRIVELLNSWGVTL